MNCKHCYLPEVYNSHEKEIPLPYLERIIQKLINFGINQLDFTGGEPFLYQDLDKFFDYLREVKKISQIPFIFNTNGLLLLKRKIRKLVVKNKDLISQLNISVESGIPEIHNEIRGKGSFKKVLKVIQFCKEEKIPITISSTIGKYNLSTLDSIFSLLEDLNLNYVGFGLFIPQINKSGAETFGNLNREEVKSFCDYLIEQRESGWEIETCSMPYLKFVAPGMEGKCCKIFKEVFAINYKGQLSTCLMEPANLGSLIVKSMEELLENQKAEEIRNPNLLKSKIKGKCSTCEKFEECLGCRFMALRKDHDYYRSDPFCPYHF